MCLLLFLSLLLILFLNLQLKKITLDGVRGLHIKLSAIVHDVLYYMRQNMFLCVGGSLGKGLNS